MNIALTVNGALHTIDVLPGELLRTTLRRLRYFSVKFGDETGDTGADAVLLTLTPDVAASYRLRNSGALLTAQVDGASIITVESLSGPRNEELSALQEQFVACGAIQCGYCTPAQLLASKRLLDENPDPTEAQVREAIAGVLCRCTGYLRPVQAVLRAAAELRGDALPPLTHEVVDAQDVVEWPTADTPDAEDSGAQDSGNGLDTQTRTKVTPITVAPPQTVVVNKGEPKVDGIKLVKGRGVFADDMEMPGMLYGGLLTSPHAHAHIRSIDASKARALPGVHAVLTHEDVERVIYASGGQSYPESAPL